MALYHATGGEQWKQSDNWLTDAPISFWHGVRTDAGGRVWELWLQENGLTGHIPPEVGNLTNLRWLSLWDNSLTGEIPPELGRLANLEVLQVIGNQLTGAIPPELGRLARLDWLKLRGNRLSGAIPPELGNLSNLACCGSMETR